VIYCKTCVMFNERNAVVRQSLDSSEQRNSQEDTGIDLSDNRCKWYRWEILCGLDNRA